MKPLTAAITPRQNETLAAIAAYQARHGFPPTVRDLMRPLGITSPNGVKCHLDALERAGYIARLDNTPRAIRIVPRLLVDQIYQSQLKRAREVDA